MFTFSQFDLVLFVHISAAIGLVGHSFSAPLLHMQIREAATPADVARWLEFDSRAVRWNPLIALALLLTGVYLGSWGWWTQPWFALAVAAWVANALLAKRVIRPSAAALMAAVTDAGAGPATPEIERLRRSTSWALATQAMIANDLAMLYIMIAQPGLIQAVAVMIAAHASLIGGWLFRHRRAQDAPGSYKTGRRSASSVRTSRGPEPGIRSGVA